MKLSNELIQLIENEVAYNEYQTAVQNFLEEHGEKVVEMLSEIEREILSERIEIENFEYFMGFMNDTERVVTVVSSIRDSFIKNNMVIVYYSDKGVCFFKVKKNTKEVLVLEFVGTGSFKPKN